MTGRDEGQTDGQRLVTPRLLDTGLMLSELSRGRLANASNLVGTVCKGSLHSP